MSKAYEAARAYVVAHCVAEADLAARARLTAGQYCGLQDAELVPQPTYRVGPTAVWSAIGRTGPDNDPRLTRSYFAPSVLEWLGRAVVASEASPVAPLAHTLQAWLRDSFAAALLAQSADAQAFGWGRLFVDGRLDETAVAEEADRLWTGWMDGGWAVCLRRFDGHHLATKEIERGRIAALTDDGHRERLSATERAMLFDAVCRLDSVLLPFAPHERVGGTPGQFIDRPVRQYGLPGFGPVQDEP